MGDWIVDLVDTKLDAALPVIVPIIVIVIVIVIVIELVELVDQQLVVDVFELAGRRV